MTERYQVTLHSQMGPRTGLLTLERRGSYFTGLLELMGYENAVQGVQAEDGNLHLFHSIRTAVHPLLCETMLALQDGHLTGETTAKACRIRWEGVPLPGGAPGQAGQEEQRA